jgi:hypothetical protein
VRLDHGHLRYRGASATEFNIDILDRSAKLARRPTIDNLGKPPCMNIAAAGMLVHERVPAFRALACDAGGRCRGRCGTRSADAGATAHRHRVRGTAD